MTYAEYLADKKRQHGDKFDPSELDQRFVPYFRTGQRIKVETCGLIITGTVGVTTGWRPVFLLIRTSRSVGSSWTLGSKDKILAVQHGGMYIAA